ncbi:MAG: F0F1-type ATP synthase assembly protein I [Planctomycetota bacterium]|jgi:F0F1-type ATP synthase assembly protein I
MSTDFGRYSTLGVQFGMTLILFSFAGHGLDRWLDTEPWLMLLGTFAGFGGGFYSLLLKVGPPSGQARAKASDPPESAEPSKDDSSES